MVANDKTAGMGRGVRGKAGVLAWVQSLLASLPPGSQPGWMLAGQQTEGNREATPGTGQQWAASRRRARRPHLSVAKTMSAKLLGGSICSSFQRATAKQLEPHARIRALLQGQLSMRRHAPHAAACAGLAGSPGAVLLGRWRRAR